METVSKLEDQITKQGKAISQVLEELSDCQIRTDEFSLLNDEITERQNYMEILVSKIGSETEGLRELVTKMGQRIDDLERKIEDRDMPFSEIANVENQSILSSIPPAYQTLLSSIPPRRLTDDETKNLLAEIDKIAGGN